MQMRETGANSKTQRKKEKGSKRAVSGQRSSSAFDLHQYFFLRSTNYEGREGGASYGISPTSVTGTRVLPIVTVWPAT